MFVGKKEMVWLCLVLDKHKSSNTLNKAIEAAGGTLLSVRSATHLAEMQRNLDVPVYVHADITEVRRSMNEAEFNLWCDALPKKNLYPLTVTGLKYFLLKQYALDLKKLMLTGTQVCTLENPTVQFAYTDIRLKPSLRSGGLGQLRTLSQKRAQRFVDRALRSCPNGVVIVQPNLVAFAEYRYPCFGNAPPEAAHAEVLLIHRRVLDVLSRRLESIPPLWRLDIIVCPDGGVYLNEIECPGATFCFGPQNDWNLEAARTIVEYMHP